MGDFSVVITIMLLFASVVFFISYIIYKLFGGSKKIAEQHLKVTNPEKPDNQELLSSMTIDVGKKVFRRGDIIGATFLGGPLAATYMIGRNFGVFGNIQYRNYTYYIGLSVSICIIVVALFVNIKIPSYIIPFLYTSLAYTLFDKTQNYFVVEHLKMGGKHQSIFTSILVTIGSFILFLCFFFVIALLYGIII